MSIPTLEIVQFRLKADVDQQAFLATVAETQAALAQLPGYIRRDVLQSDDGIWVDMVYWQSNAEALSAAAAFATMPEMASFVQLLDQQSITMLHLAQVRSYA